MGVLEGHTTRVAYASLNDKGTIAVTLAGVAPNNQDNDEDDDEADDEPSWSVKIWSMETMKCTADLMSDSNAFKCLTNRLVLGTADGTIKVWDIGGSAPVALLDPAAVSDMLVTSLEASETANVAMAGLLDGSSCLWDLRSGQTVRQMLRGQEGPVTSISVDSACRIAVSASCGAGNASHVSPVHVWDLGSGRCIKHKISDRTVMSVHMHEDGGQYLASDDCLSLKTWSTSALWGDDRPLVEHDLKDHLDIGEMEARPAITASKDLSRVAYCCHLYHEGPLEITTQNLGPWWQCTSSSHGFIIRKQ